jgi:hypothetical protein
MKAEGDDGQEDGSVYALVNAYELKNRIFLDGSALSLLADHIDHNRVPAVGLG